MSFPFSLFVRKKTKEGDYRGFSSSISHSFLLKEHRTSDACSLACCGILQSDRDRFLIEGIYPPSWSRRIFLHIFTPCFLFGMACWGAVHIPNQSLNQFLCTLTIGFILMLFVGQCIFKGRWKRVMVRKAILWRTHASPKSEQPDQDDESTEHAKEYLAGQSRYDLNCAHALIGCYGTDISSGSDEKDENGELILSRQPPTRDICAYLYRLLSNACCGILCGCYCQICGLAALAQEARQVDMLLDADQRRMDYVTLQESLDYYMEILMQRSTKTTTLLTAWNTTLSTLSHQLVQLWLLVLIGLVLISCWLRFSFWHIVVYMAIFGHAWLLLGLLHWPFHKDDVSLDLMVKAFSAGFFLITVLAAAWETIAGLVVRLFMDVVLALSGIDIAVDADGYDAVMPTWYGFGHAAETAASRQDYIHVYGQQHPFAYSLFLLINAFVLAAFIEELVKYLGFNMVEDHADFWTQAELEGAIKTMVEETNNSTDENVPKEDKEKRVKQLLSLPTQAQERTLTSKSATLTLVLCAVALGFACCENLIYVFIYNENSLNVEFTVLIARMLFPVHVICAAIQSLGVVQRDLEKDPTHQLGKILLPAVIFHGLFDYILLMGDFLEKGLQAIMLAFVTMLCGLVYYLWQAQMQRERLQARDAQTTVDQSTLL